MVGSLLLVLAFAVNPLSQDVDPTAALRSAERSNGRWLGMAAIMFIASVCLTFGVPSVLTLLTGRGHGVGVVGAGLFAIGTIGLSSYAMVLVVVRALVLRDLLTPKDVASLMNDDAVAVFLGSWITAFLLGLVPMWLLNRAQKFALKRRISSLETAARTAATTPVVTTPAPAPVERPVAKDDVLAGRQTSPHAEETDAALKPEKP